MDTFMAPGANHVHARNHQQTQSNPHLKKQLKATRYLKLQIRFEKVPAHHSLISMNFLTQHIAHSRFSDGCMAFWLPDCRWRQNWRCQ